MTTQSAVQAVPFVDVPPFPVQAVETLHAEGFFVGIGQSQFDPDSPLTRAQAAVLIIRLVHGSDFKPPDLPGDDHWGLKWVRQAVAEGYMDGSALVTLDEPVRRVDAAVLLRLALDH